MFVDQVQPHYYYSLIRIVTLHGSQAIRIHTYPVKGYKKQACILVDIYLYLAHLGEVDMSGLG